MTLSAAVRPAHCTHQPFVKTFGPEVADLGALANFPPDPEQELGLDLIFAFDSVTGKSVFSDFCAICARQNLKTGLFKLAALGYLYITDQPKVMWSAHEFDTAKSAHQDLADLIESTPALNRRLKPNGVHYGAADRSITLKTGQQLIFKARTKGGGRGLSAPKLVLDEAFALKPEHIGAIRPVMSVQPDPQILYGSSAGLAESEVLRGIRDRGRPGISDRLAYLEWGTDPGGCADPVCDHRFGYAKGCALDDVENWRAANPLLERVRPNGTGLDLKTVQGEREQMPPAEFARERLGWWDDPLDELQPISPEDWAKFGVDDVPEGEPRFFLDCSPNLRSATIAGAVLWDGKPHVSLADYKQGTHWVPGRVEELRRKYPNAKWQFEHTGPASALAEYNSELGKWTLAAEKNTEPPLTGVWVGHPFNGTEMARGCGHLQGLVKDAKLTHSGDRMIESALRNSVKRDVGDPGLWAWGRKKSSGDISPLVAVTGALWLLNLQPSYDLLSSVY